MSKRLTITAREVVDFRRELERYHAPFTFGVSCDGSVLGRTSTEDLYRDLGIGRFPKSRLEHPTGYVVVAYRDGEIRKLEIPSEALVVSFIQAVSDGVLLVGARCHWRPEGAEENAVVYDWTSREQRRFVMGDGLQDVRTTAEGTIWASSFDEGVFGNYGWGHAGPAPVGAPGLVAFHERGDVRWSYDAAAAGTDAIGALGMTQGARADGDKVAADGR